MTLYERAFGRLKERKEWGVIRRALSDKTPLTPVQIDEIGELEGDSLDLVELIMELEDKYKLRLPP